MVDRIRLYTSPFITRNQEIKILEKLNQAIKQDESSDQASISTIKILDRVAAGSTGHIVVTTPCC